MEAAHEAETHFYFCFIPLNTAPGGLPVHLRRKPWPTAVAANLPASTMQPVQPTSPAGSMQPGGPAAAEATLGQPADQIDQGLNDLESTLQAQDTGANSLDTGQIDQSLSNLESTFQAQDTSGSSVDTGQTDQSLNELEQTLQAEPTP